MEQLVIGTYEEVSQPKPIEPKPHIDDLVVQPSGKEVRLESVTMFIPQHNHPLETFRPNPVYVAEDTNKLVYNSRVMEKGKEYHVTWCGEHFVLIRNDDGVAVYRFEADGDESGD